MTEKLRYAIKNSPLMDADYVERNALASPCVHAACWNFHFCMRSGLGEYTLGTTVAVRLIQYAVALCVCRTVECNGSENELRNVRDIV
jgi:hypothetical protein